MQEGGSCMHTDLTQTGKKTPRVILELPPLRFIKSLKNMGFAPIPILRIIPEIGIDIALTDCL